MTLFPLWTVPYLLAICSFAGSASLRLPLEVIPFSYSIQLVPYFDEGDSTRQFTFDGNVSILVKAQKPGKLITLHALNIEVNGMPTVRDETSGSVLQVAAAGMNDNTEQLTLQLVESLVQGNTYRLDISYTGQLNDNMFGFYRSSYKVNGTKRWLAVTQFEPTHAREAFPCFDEPALKATFNISIARPTHMNAISNMPLEKSIGPDASLNGRIWDVFQTSMRMSPYLVAFVVSDFKAVEEGSFRVWASPDIYESGKFALEISPNLLKKIGSLVKVLYTLPKMDQVAVPDFQFGAMENWGLCTYRLGDLLTDYGTNVSIATTVMHEFAHQWFGDLVTLSWWKYTWLNEGFADLFQFYATDLIFPEWMLMKTKLQNQLSVMEADSKNSTFPMTNDVETPDEIMNGFGSIAYAKGGAVLKMIQHALSDQTFFNGLHYYLSTRAYEDATADDLSAGLQKAVDEDDRLPEGLTVKPIVDSWTLQSGYPVVTVTRNYSSGTAELKQAQFFLQPTSKASAAQWYVPISFTTSEKLNFLNTLASVWLTPNNHAELQGLPDENQWIILNNQATGYFRVNYDKQNWKLLSDQLNSENYTKINILNRMQIVDDATNLAKAGLLDVETAMGITRYLEWETDPAAWEVGLKGLEQLYRKLAGSSYFPALKSFYSRLIQKFFNSVGFTQQAGESYQTTAIRPKLLYWACLLGNEDCVREATRTTAARSDSIDGIDEKVRAVLYCTVVRNDGDVSWNWLWDIYQSTTSAKERQAVLRAFGCATDTKLISRLLHLVVEEDSGLRPEDRMNVFSSACNGQDSKSCKMTLKFLVSRVHELADLFGEYESVAMVLLRIARDVKTEEQLNYLKHIIMKNEELNVAEDIIASAVDIAERNVHWQKTSGAGVITWLSNQEFVLAN